MVLILYPPVRFDINEWFLIVSGTAAMVLALSLRRRLPVSMSLLIVIYNVYIGQAADFIIGIPPYDFYDVNDRPEYEYFDFVTYFFLYTPVAYSAVNLYDKWRASRYFTLCVLTWAALTTLLEGLADFCQVFHYKHWNIAYSFPVYTFVFASNFGLYHVVRHVMLRSKNRRGASP